MFSGPRFVRSAARLAVAASLLTLVVGVASCGDEPSAAPDDAIVQVRESDDMVATGIAVDGGAHVVTVLYYRDTMPAGLEVADRSGGRHRVTVETVDFRTGATLLDVLDGPLASAMSPKPVTPVPDQPVVVRGWSRPTLGFEKQDGYSREILGDPVLKETSVVVVTGLAGTPRRFRVKFPGVELPVSVDVNSGDVVTDANGRVLGLAGNLAWV